MKESTAWHSVPPPSVGWWPASRYRDGDVIRWWNGKCWSHDSRPSFSAESAARSARIEAFDSVLIEWTERPASWPARSKT